jgi:[acyl-carrier-protein] S-malonyltransferase
MTAAALLAGQGAQHRGMFEGLHERSAVVRDVFDRAGAVLGFDVAGTCFGADEETLRQTEFTQPCVLTCDIAAWHVLQDLGLPVDVLAGFSLGEYAAVYAAGVLDFEAVLGLVQLRAAAMVRAMDGAVGGMLAVRDLDSQDLAGLLAGEQAWIANFTAPRQHVVSGTEAALKDVARRLDDTGVGYTPLAVSLPFHCELLAPAKQELARAFGELDFRPARCPVVMNADGAAHTDGKEIQDLLLAQTDHPVRWLTSLNTMRAFGVSEWIELGPGKTLTGLVLQFDLDAECQAIRDPRSLQRLTRSHAQL